MPRKLKLTKARKGRRTSLQTDKETEGDKKGKKAKKTDNEAEAEEDKKRKKEKSADHEAAESSTKRKTMKQTRGLKLKKKEGQESRG